MQNVESVQKKRGGGMKMLLLWNTSVANILNHSGFSQKIIVFISNINLIHNLSTMSKGIINHIAHLLLVSGWLSLDTLSFPSPFF